MGDCDSDLKTLLILVKIPTKEDMDKQRVYHRPRKLGAKPNAKNYLIDVQKFNFMQTRGHPP